MAGKLERRGVIPTAAEQHFAAAIHNAKRLEARRGAWRLTAELDRPFAALTAEHQANSLAAARRIARVLAAGGLAIVPAEQALPADAVGTHLAASMETMASAEHLGWMEERFRQGWVYGPARDDDRKLHPSLVPYAALSEAEKEKDRANIRLYPVLLAGAGLGLAHPP